MTAAPCPEANRSRLPAAARLVRLAALLVASVTALGGPVIGTAAAAEDFVAPAAIGELDATSTENPTLVNARGPQVLSTPDGTSYASWLAPAAGGKATAMLATRPAGGSWTTEVIAPATRVAGGVPIGRAGDGTLTALVVDPTTQALVALTRPAGGTFGNAITLAAGRSTGLALSVNASGEAVAAWRTSTDSGATWTAVLAHRSAAGSWDWGGPLRSAGNPTGSAQLPTPTFAVGTPGGTVSWADVDPLSVSLNDAGKFVVGVALPSAPTGGTMQGHAFFSTGTAGSLGRLLMDAPAANVHQSRVRVAVSPSGAVGISWLEAALTASPYEVNSANFVTAAAGSSSFSGGTLPGLSPAAAPIAFGKTDTFTVLWSIGNAGSVAGRLWYGIGPAGSNDVATSAQLSPSADGVWGGSIATNAAGDRLVTWANATTSSIQARFAPASTGAFGDTKTVSSLGTGVPIGPRAALDADGNAATTWLRSRSDGAAVQAAGFDSVAPKLADVVLPGAGTATLPLAFSARATDAWSTPKLAWGFGDGGAGTGGAVSHTYGAPNAYGATVTATDDVGNSTTQSGSVAIGAKPPVDADGDGVFSDKDCNDTDARVRPGALDIPGNGIDENCDGKDAAYGVLATTVRVDYSQVRNRLRFAGFSVRGVRLGDRIKLRCSGTGCAKSVNVERRVKKVNKRAEYDLLDVVRKLRLGPGAKLTVTVSRDGFKTRINTWTVRAGKRPKESLTCQLPGTKQETPCN